ncbi:hypothetical protein FRB99_004377 [Tulasnella sp. 403]|nr:hypothetical protein FRB99_004377 [Tulasnella sp. 403]
MSEGRTNAKSTVYVGNLADGIDEQVLVEVFSTFGDVMEVQLPTHDKPNYQFAPDQNDRRDPNSNAGKHRGFAFVTFGTPIDAQDAIDNMDLNELRGKVLKVNLARPMKGPVAGLGNRAIWETEEWLKNYGTKPTEAASASNKQGTGDEGPMEESTEGAGEGGDDMEE